MITTAHGDCLELMKELPDNSIDMVLCDLPYGVTHSSYDKKIDLAALWKEYKRVCRSGAAIVLTATQPFTTELINSNPKWFRYTLVWDKKLPVGFLNANRMPLRVHEDILVFYDHLPIYNPQMRKGKWKLKGRKDGDDEGKRVYGKYKPSQAYNNEYYPTSILTVSNGDRTRRETKDGGHPTQKPVALCEWLIKTYSNPGSVILDNCMGSGSTGVACARTGRSFVGYELDEHWFEVAQTRIQSAVEQGVLEEKQDDENTETDM